MAANEVLAVAGFAVALLALLLSMAHVAWQVWWQHRQQKERVRAIACVGAKPCIRVHNIGVIPVFLASVELVFETTSGTRRLPLQCPFVHRVLAQDENGLSPEVWQLSGVGTYEEPLERGAACVFAFPTGVVPIIEMLAAAKGNGAYISVCSNAGEIFRVGGKETLAFLTAVENVGKESGSARSVKRC